MYVDNVVVIIRGIILCDQSWLELSSFFLSVENPEYFKQTNKKSFIAGGRLVLEGELKGYLPLRRGRSPWDFRVKMRLNIWLVLDYKSPWEDKAIITLMVRSRSVG